jgi:hypothetical protein
MSAVHKHGIVDTLQQEFRGVASNAVDLVGSAANLAQHGSQQFTPLLRSTSRKFQTRTQVAVSTAGNVVRSTRRQAGSAIEEHVTMRLKRVWHLFLMSLILCWVVPIVALRPYHPLNSVVGNLGLLWGIFWVVCPPRQARHRGKRMAMLMLWPLLLVLLPLGVRYCFNHPQVLRRVALLWRRRWQNLRGSRSLSSISSEI